MGITGELVRNVFSKSHSIKRHEYSHVKTNGVERKKWSNSVRSYLCGDEYNSVVAADDSNSTVGFASFRATNVSSNNGEADFTSEMDTNSVITSEATVDQPLVESYKQEDAAVIIQSAFRRFLARRARDDDVKMESVGTSIEVQTGNSQSESFHDPRTIRNRGRAQVLKLQEDWDDSTVSSVISKMRIKNKMEAATRRERALAYAFSQQLRISSKKRESRGNNDKGWSWLERWMAAREPDEKTSVFKKRISLEKESCGSNEVSSQLK